MEENMTDVTLDLSKEELDLLSETLLKVSRQTKTEWLENEKLCIDSQGVPKSELGSELKQTQYEMLLRKIEEAKKSI